MPSMPDPTATGQTRRPGGEQVILGVDTHKDVHVAAVITVLGVLLASAEFPDHRGRLPAAAGLGARLRACCAAPGWKAPAPTARR